MKMNLTNNYTHISLYSRNYYKIFSCSCIAVFSLFNIIGNGSICMAIYVDPVKKLRSPFSCFVFNTSLSDLLFALFPNILFLVIQCWNKVPVVLEDCSNTCFFVLATSSLFSMILLLFDRFSAIVRPLRYRTVDRDRRNKLLIFMQWTFSIVVPTFLYLKKGYVITSLYFLNVTIVTSCIVFLCTWAIVIAIGNKTNFPDYTEDNTMLGIEEFLESSNFIQRHLNKIKENKTNLFRRRSTLCRSGSIKHSKQILKLYTIMFIELFICLLPVVVVSNLSSTFIAVNEKYLIHSLFALFTCINPYLYSWRLKDYRTSIKYLFHSKNNRRKHSSSCRIQSISYLNGTRAGRSSLPLITHNHIKNVLAKNSNIDSFEDLTSQTACNFEEFESIRYVQRRWSV